MNESSSHNAELTALLEENKRLMLKADALDRAHLLLDRLGIPPAQGCVCDDPNCETHIEHRIHMLSDLLGSRHHPHRRSSKRYERLR